MSFHCQLHFQKYPFFFQGSISRFFVLLISYQNLPQAIFTWSKETMSSTATVTVNGGTKTATLSFEDNFVQIIDGRPSPTKESRNGLNPATKEARPSVPLCTQADLDNAVTAAKRAFKSWSKVPYEERRAAVLAYADAVDKYREQFRDLLTAEQGKPVCCISYFPQDGTCGRGKISETNLTSDSTIRCRDRCCH